MNVHCYNQSVYKHIFQDSVVRVVEYVCEFLHLTTDEIHVYFVDEKRISELHLEFFDDPSLTDCITIPLNTPGEPVPHHILGEIFICPKVAETYAKNHNLSEKEELLRYLIHGILHLNGLDDATEAEYNLMKKKENEILLLLEKKQLGLETKASCKPKE